MVSLNRKVCRHCGREPVSRPRGLGWKCYYRPEVLALYPSSHPNARRGVGNLTGGHRRPAAPTNAPPGTLVKLIVMGERAARGEMLWHPDDATIED